jgi:hypothetical protein
MSSKFSSKTSTTNHFKAGLIVGSSLLLFLIVHAQAGGPDPAEPRAPAGGDCYRAYPYPLNWQQAKVVNQTGWQEMPYSDKLRISQLVAAKKADWLLVPDHRLCGPVLGEMKLYATWFWRPR